MLSKAYWFAAALAVAGCSGATTSGTEVTKAQVAQGDFSDGEDICAAQGWYGDGECDTFCSESDSDCTPVAGEPVVCAAFVEERDGVCRRSAADACKMQDPDCVEGDGGGVACALLLEGPDQACRRTADDPCRFQDPDCQDGVVCPAIESLPAPDGRCELRNDPCWADPDCGAVVCPAIAVLPDGVCEQRADDPCWSDPDCDEPVACAEYIEEPDGVCSRPADDPCISQDPDCIPTVCATFAPVVPDGVCSMPAGDPCWSSDPDCGSCAPQAASGGGVCDQVLGYVWDGSSCVGVSGCYCEGAACGELHASPEDCAAAYVACTAG